MPLADSIPGCDSGFFEYGGDGAIPMRASEGLTRVPVARLERREHGVAVGTGFPGVLWLVSDTVCNHGRDDKSRLREIISPD